MPTVTIKIEKPFQNGFDYVPLFQMRDWVNEKPEDISLLRPHNYLLDRREVIRLSARKGYENQIPRQAPDAASVYPNIWNGLGRTCEQISYDKFRGKLYKGSAALGITIAQWRQSAEQMRGYYRDLAGRQETMARMMTRGWKPRVLANRWLEFVFGAVPLYEDIYATLTTVIDTHSQLFYVRSSHKVENFLEMNIPGVYRGCAVSYRMSRASLVSVQNPNLWLAERAGLLNPARVAWDIVPWSFAVNMFVNINSLVNSLTDFTGLEFTGYNETRTMDYREVRVYPFCSGSYKGRDQRRVTGVSPIAPRHLMFRLPKVNFETLATAASLATQRYQKLRRLALLTIRPLHPNHPFNR